MSKGNKYAKLKEYLENSNLPIITLTFRDIEKVADVKLSASAYKYSEQWWSNNYNHSQAVAWLGAGYKTDLVTETYADEKIIFFKRR